MQRDPEIEAWFASVRGQPLLHLASGRIGKAEELYLPGVYIDPSSCGRVDEYVLKLATGDCFLVLAPMDPAKPFDATATVKVLSPVEVQYLDATAGELSKTITRAVGAALVTRDGPFPITAESALRLIVVALQGQMRALQQAAEEGTE